MKRFRFLLIALIGAALLSAAWPANGFTVLLFFGWVPLLWVEAHIQRTRQFFAITYLHMFTWNVAVTWWVWNASPAGAAGAFVANSLLMCLPWLLFRYTKKVLGNWIGYGSLIVYWVCFEFIHHQWELSWPWLTLGNGFATKPEWIQWYEYTGTTGGSIWILLANILAFTIFAQYRRTGRTFAYNATLASFLLVLATPIIISRFLQPSRSEKVIADLANATQNVVVIQPNVDPYTEKFSSPVEAQVAHLLRLSTEQVDSSTTLLIWPETAIPAQVWEHELNNDPVYAPVFDFLKTHPRISLLTGIDSYRRYPGKDSASATARKAGDGSNTVYYDAYNTAAWFNSEGKTDLYHKAKLVPGVETLPSFLGFMGSWFESFGGVSGTLGRDSERKVFSAGNTYFKVAPVICYESIYGDYVTEYMRKGANLLTIITNDGWWDNTPGYRQHMQYARLRAIETRKWIARSANTGISCFIDPMGNVIDPQPWDKTAAIKMAIPPSEGETYFVKYGDILATACSATVIALLVTLLFRLIRNAMARKKQSV